METPHFTCKCALASPGLKCNSINSDLSSFAASAYMQGCMFICALLAPGRLLCCMPACKACSMQHLCVISDRELLCYVCLPASECVHLCVISDRELLCYVCLHAGVCVHLCVIRPCKITYVCVIRGVHVCGIIHILC